MTVDKFIKRCVDYVKKGDNAAMSQFMARHFAFCVLHRTEIESRLVELDAEYKKREEK